MEPSSQCLAAAPLIAICPALLDQIKTFRHARSPLVHQPGLGQEVSPAGAWLHGAANQVRLDDERGAFGGQAEIEHGVDPNWQGAVQSAPPPAGQSPEAKLALLTNSRVVSCARRVPPFRQTPPFVKAEPS